MRRAIVLLSLVVTCAGSAAAVPPHAHDAVEKKPVPDAAALGQAEATITKLFAARFKNAKTDRAVARALAAELLAQGKETKDDDKLQFMAFKLASELSAGAGDNAAALEAIAALAQTFKVDTLDMKSSIYAQVEKNTANKEDALTLADTVLNLVEEALESDNFDTAAKLMATAEKAAAKGEKLALYAKVEKRGKEVRDAKKAFDAIKPLLDQVAGGDAKASLEVGKYYCFTKGNYDKGLPLLAKCGDATLKALAERDLGQPKEARKRVALGDEWSRLAEGLQGLARRQTLRRAYHWYQLALPGLEGLTRVRIEQEVESLAKLFPTGTTSAPGADITAELRKIEGAHNGGVQAVAISQDGSLILSGGFADNAVRLWDAATGKKLRDFIGHGGSVQSVAISPDRKFILSGSTDNTMRLWNLETGLEVRRFNGHNDWVRAVYFLPGNRVISACDDRSLRIFDVNTGNLLKTLTGHTNYINGLSVSRDGKSAMTGSLDFTARIWDLETGKELRKFSHAKSVEKVALSPDGKRGVSTSYDNTVKVWDTDNGNELRALPHPGMVWFVRVSPDGHRVYTASGGGTALNDGSVQFKEKNNLIRVFDLYTGKELRELGGHTNYVKSLDISADGRFLVSGAQDGSVRLWGAK